jgi:hypothetical protein
MKPIDLLGKTLAVVIVQQEPGKEDQVIIVDGVVQEADAVKEILCNCELSLTLYGGPFPEDGDASDYIKTGLNINI